MLQDLRHAIRVLGRERGYSMVALLAIALGVGATTTLFSVTYGVLLKPLPWPDRIVSSASRNAGAAGAAEFPGRSPTAPPTWRGPKPRPSRRSADGCPSPACSRMGVNPSGSGSAA